MAGTRPDAAPNPRIEPIRSVSVGLANSEPANRALICLRAGLLGLSLSVVAGRGVVGQCGEHPSTQELVLLATSARSIWWPLLHLTAGNDFARVERLCCVG
jgi:hypothetical protein